MDTHIGDIDMILVTRTLRGQEEEVMCFSPEQGVYWRTLETERALGFPNVRRLPSLDAAYAAKRMNGGDSVRSVNPPVTPALLLRQAE